MSTKLPAATVLLTCVGGQLAPWLLRSLKACSRVQVRTVGTDANPQALGRLFADAFHRIPSGNDPDYAATLLQVCLQEKVKILFPTSDEEALALAERADEFREAGIHVSCPPVAKKVLLANKADMYDYLAGLGLPVPPYHRVCRRVELEHAARALGYPQQDFLVKPTVARGGRGVWVISGRTPSVEERNRQLAVDFISLETLLSSLGEGTFPELMAMPSYPGDMFDVDVLADSGGRPHYLVSRRRYHVRTNPFRGSWLDPHPEVLALARQVQEKLRLPYLFDYDVILDGKNHPWLLEVNPRMSGSVAVSIFHGLNLLEFAILMFLKQEVPVRDIPWGRGVKPFLDLAETREIGR